MMLGWRKLSAWFLVYLMTVATMIFKNDIGQTASGLLETVTIGFFIANAIKPAGSAISGKLVDKASK
jgi:hypothetical protein